MWRTEFGCRVRPIRRAALLLALVPAAALAAPASAQANPNNENNLPLHNGVDVAFGYSDPSVGVPTGTFPPDFSGDLYWKVVPKESLLSPTGTLEISGLALQIFDTNWTTPSSYYDLMFTRGKASATTPGVIEPDFGDPNAVFLSLGGTGLPNPCVVSPALCMGIFCPPYPPSGYELDMQLGTCSGDGLVITADGTQDLVITAFLPGGMPYTSIPPVACVFGDYVLMDFHSTDERQADWLGNGWSAYGGFQIGGAGAVLGPEPLFETSALEVQFCEPMISIRRTSALPPLVSPNVGLDGVELPLGSGSPFGYVVYDEDGIGDTCFAASTLLPPLPAPGYSIFGASLLLDPHDPTFLASVRQGPVQLVPHGGVPFDDGVFVSPAIMTIPPTAAGLALYSQALTIDLATLTSRSTQVTRTRLHP